MRLLSREALRANIQAINHDLDPYRREADLRAWCAREFPDGHEASWFELAGAAGAGISIYALFALATETRCSEVEIERTNNAYFPWASAVATMLDSYVDHIEDTANGDHVYVSHYPSPEHAIDGMSQLMRRTFAEVRALPDAERHMVIIACMVAMYLSKNSARNAAVRAATLRLTSAGGAMTRMLLPILRLWRAAYNQRAM
jgi:tetraprenyl-beta-curcumene synthase